MNECILCGKKLEENESDFCTSCFNVLTAKYPKSKFKEVKKWHKKNARKLKR